MRTSGRPGWGARGCGEGVGLSNEWGQGSAFADLVAAMLEARHDYATAAFDDALARAEADGSLDPAAARLLRWWQRETVRAVVDHAARVLPPAVLALQEAERAAAEAADQALATIATLTAQPDTDEAAHLVVLLPDTDAAAVPEPPPPIGRVELRPWPGEPPMAPPTGQASAAGSESDARGARRTLVAGLRVLPDPTTAPPPT
jgi:hypothetical protein